MTNPQTTPDADDLQLKVLDFLDELNPNPVDVIIALSRIVTEIVSGFRKVEKNERN